MNKTFLIVIVLATLLILGGGIWVMSATRVPTADVKLSSNAKAYIVEPKNFDWGEIQYNGFKATKTFTIKNEGKDTLKLSNIKTSCHCTIAYATIDGKDSPRFGMSGVSSWIGEITPGKEAKLTVVFDQAYHGPQGIGPVTRFVSVETNDARNSKLTFTLTGMVVK